MIDYLYDGTFEGFLTCVHAHYYREKAAGIYPGDRYQRTMLGGFAPIDTQIENAMTVYRAIETKISPHDLRRVYRVFLSSVEGKETMLLHYIRLGFQVGGKLSLLDGNPYVFPVRQADRKVSFETHRLKGLIRFSELKGGVLYAPVEPDHDVLELIAGHFADRFRCEPFLIHDKRRGKALVSQNGSWYITAFSAAGLPGFSAAERDYSRLWKEYFDNIAVKERTNPRCQKNFMPVRYWKNLTEFSFAPDL